jgi:hypothetical protein
MRINVDLPEPLGPRTAVKEPSGMEKVAPDQTRREP